MAKNPRYQGAGSSTINPFKIENAYDNFIENGIEVEYAKGYERIESETDEELRKEAIEIAKRNEVVLIFAGLTENYESEGVDRNNLEIPQNQNLLIDEICKVNQNVVIVLSNGSPIEMPWKDKVKGIITGYIGGESGGKAIVNCILGKVNPSGKLAETYPMKLEDTPCFNNYPGNEITVEYKESIYVGYRYYDKNKVQVLYPFGFGLSYTKFDYSDIKIEKGNNKIKINFKIKNTGNFKGKEIAQVYVGKKESKIFRPEKELKAFEKIELNPNEEKEINIELDKTSFEYFDTNAQKWQIEAGTYDIKIGKSSQDIVLQGEITIDSNDEVSINKISEKYYTGDIQNITDQEFEKLICKKLPNKILNLENINEENTLEQIKNTKIGKIIYENQMEKMNKLLEEQNVNKATKVMMDLQKPLKKFYEKKSSKFTKEMVDELIRIAKNNELPENNEFVDEYLK